MIFEGEHSVIQAIKEKKQLIEAGEDHSHIRVLFIQGGGIMRVAYGAGTALALEEMGHTNSFSSLVGISSGAPNVAYFAAGTIHRGINILLNDCQDRRFINPWRFWNQVNTDHFISIMRNDEEKNVSLDKVFANPADLYFGAAYYDTAKPVLLQPKNDDDFFKSLHASLNMSNISPVNINIAGIRYTDGGFASPHIFARSVEQIQPTHVLIATNNDRDFKSISIFEKTLNRTLYRFRLNGLLATAINSRREARDEALANIINSEVKTAVIWGDGAIDAFESDTNKIEAAIEASRTWCHELFSMKD
jgi:predicted patatin/cPLA2 family phospholipase